MLRQITLAMLGALVAAAPAAAADQPWHIDAGMAVVKVTGVRSYEIPDRKLAHDDTSLVTARYVRLTRTMGSQWSLGLGYVHYNELRSSGASGSSDIFDRGEGALAVVVPLEMTERVQELILDGRWRWAVAADFAVSVGPVLSYFDSRAEWGSSYFGAASLNAPIQKFYVRGGGYHESDIRLGGAVGLSFGLTSRLGVQVDYRYATPPRRDLHLASAGLRWRF